MKIKDKTYWIVYSKVKKKYPYLPNSVIHIFTRKAIEKRKHKKTAPKGLTASMVVIDEFPLK